MALLSKSRLKGVIVAAFSFALILPAAVTNAVPPDDLPGLEVPDDEDYTPSDYASNTEEPTGPPAAGGTLYITQPKTSAALKQIYNEPRAGDMQVVGTFNYAGKTITFGTYVEKTVPIQQALDESYRDAYETAQNKNPPSLVSQIPLYVQVDYAVKGGVDYNKLSGQAGVTANHPTLTESEEDALYQSAVAEADAAAAAEMGTTTSALPAASCGKWWRPKYSAVKAGNHRVHYGGTSTYEYYGQVYTKFKWSGAQMRTLLACNKRSGWEQDFFMDPGSGYWLKADTRNWSSDLPRVYHDTTFLDNGRQFGFGVTRASRVKTNTNYYIKFTAHLGPDKVDTAGMVNQRTRPPSWFPGCDSLWCMFTVSGVTLDVKRGFTVPGYYSWLIPV